MNTPPIDVSPTVANAPPTAAPPAEAEPEPRKLDTPEAVFAEILDRSGLEALTDVELTRDAWLIDPASSKRVHVELGKASPFNPRTEAFGIFHDEDGARVYTTPAQGAVGTCERYMFTSVGVSCATLSLEQFIDAMAGEYAQLAGIDDDDDDDEPQS